MKTIILKYPGTCSECGAALAVGEEARYYGRGRLYCPASHRAPGAGQESKPAHHPLYVKLLANKTPTTRRNGQKVYYLSCAETSQLVRLALSRAFPENRFSVRSHTYSGGASIRVKWGGGPSRHEVEQVARQMEGSRFDGMIDLQTAAEHWLLPDATVTLARVHGTEGSQGTIPERDEPPPGDAVLVHLAADFVFCEPSDA